MLMFTPLFWTCAIFDRFRRGTYLAKNMDFGANTELLNDPGTAMLNRHSSLFDNPHLHVG